MGSVASVVLSVVSAAVVSAAVVSAAVVSPAAVVSSAVVSPTSTFSVVVVRSYATLITSCSNTKKNHNCKQCNQYAYFIFFHNCSF